MRNTKAYIVMGCLLGMVGCTKTGKLRLDGHVAQTNQPLSTAAQQSLSIGDGTLVISRARVAVSEIEIQGGGEDDEREAEMGAAVIDLNVNGQPTTVAVQEVEAGSYDTLGLEFTTRDFDGQTASIVIEGTYAGAPFTFRSSWAPEAEFPLKPAVDVPANGEATAGVTFDVASWFTAPDGSAIDPAASGSQAIIEGKIVDSISAAAEVENSEDGED